MIEENLNAFRNDTSKGNLQDLKGQIVVYSSGELLFSTTSISELEERMEGEYLQIQHYTLAIAGTTNTMDMERLHRVCDPSLDEFIESVQKVDFDFPEIESISPYWVMVSIGLGYEEKE